MGVESESYKAVNGLLVFSLKFIDLNMKGPNKHYIIRLGSPNEQAETIDEASVDLFEYFESWYNNFLQNFQ